MARGQSFRHTLSLPYNAKSSADSRIEVLMRSGRQRSLVASGKVDVRDFHYSTSFSVMTLPDGSLDYLGGSHCCSGGICGRMCVTCAGAFFVCDLVGCSI